MVWHQKSRWSTAKKTIYDGKVYDSKFEASYAMILSSMVKRGEIDYYERQVKIPLIVNGKTVSNYYCDFVAHHKDGTKEYIECKGLWSEYSRLKWKLFCAIYEDLEDTRACTVIKQQSWKFRSNKSK